MKTIASGRYILILLSILVSKAEEKFSRLRYEVYEKCYDSFE